jgi:hypothetical protein
MGIIIFLMLDGYEIALEWSNLTLKLQNKTHNELATFEIFIKTYIWTMWTMHLSFSYNL